jgi:MFS transporter, OFA family, oxalate/formate antiporter
MDQPVKNHGVRVTAAAVGINLALGILYTWSVVSKEIPADWKWSETERSWPYSIACLVFALMMVPAGRLQDKVGPRMVASIGGLLVGIGMILASLTTTPIGYILGFGLLAGTGIGFGYASATPPAVKWFPAGRTGLIAGIVVSGFGLASVYAAPLTRWLIGGAQVSDTLASGAVGKLLLVVQSLQHWVESLGVGAGIPSTMLILGFLFLVVVVCLSQFLTPPPRGYVPGGAAKIVQAGATAKKEDFSPGEVLGTVQFYLLWFMYACGAGAGLMVISKLATIGEKQAGYEHGFVLVAAMAIGNGAGRIVAGSLSDKLGRGRTMFGCFLFQAVLMVLLSMANKDAVAGAPVLANMPFLTSEAALIVMAALMGANYGANLSLFPSVTKDYYGLKNFGVNYGFVFTAWGIGGFVFPLLAGRLHDIHGHYYYSYYLAAGLLVLAAMVTFTVKSPHHARAATDQVPEHV